MNEHHGILINLSIVSVFPHCYFPKVELHLKSLGWGAGGVATFGIY